MANDQISNESDAGAAAPLSYAVKAPPPFGQPTPVAPGVHWLRMPLPFKLDHVNLWLIDDGEGWTLVDTGIADRPTKELWQGVFRDFLRSAPARRLIVTHFHPDHTGLAGWLMDQLGSRLWMTRQEWLTARLLSLDNSEETGRSLLNFFRLAGLDGDRIDNAGLLNFNYTRRVSPLPRHFRAIGDGEEIEIGGRVWRVIIGRGHAPEHACLYSPSLGILISGDQILPRISTNVSVSPAEPDGNPLADFLASLRSLAELPESTLVLPSHGLPFRGHRARVGDLLAHHEDRLDQLRTRMVGAMTAVEALPLLFERALDSHELRFAIGETLAHLTYLVRSGEIDRELSAEEPWRFRLRS